MKVKLLIGMVLTTIFLFEKSGAQCPITIDTASIVITGSSWSWTASASYTTNGSPMRSVGVLRGETLLGCQTVSGAGTVTFDTLKTRFKEDLRFAGYTSEGCKSQNECPKPKPLFPFASTRQATNNACPVKITTVSATQTGLTWSVTVNYTVTGTGTYSIGLFCFFTQVGCHNITTSGSFTFTGISCINKNLFYALGYSSSNCHLSDACDAATLPIEITSFTGWQNDGDVKLEWNAEKSGETLPSIFQIERSIDGEHYSVIGHDTADITQLKATYRYTDVSPRGSDIFYYRIGIQTIDGTVKYSSKMVTVKLHGEQRVSHHMSGSMLVVDGFNDTPNDQFAIAIFDLSGRLILKLEKSKQINIGSLHEGEVYAVQVFKMKEKVGTFKFEKIQ